MRKRVAAQLFSGADFESAGIIKAQMEIDEETRQRAQVEMQRNLARKPFEYEPFNYEWCAAFTNLDLVAEANNNIRTSKEPNTALEELMKNGGARINPVSGEVTPLYILCAWINENGDCPKHAPG